MAVKKCLPLFLERRERALKIRLDSLNMSVCRKMTDAYRPAQAVGKFLSGLERLETALHRSAAVNENEVASSGENLPVRVFDDHESHISTATI